MGKSEYDGSGKKDGDNNANSHEIGSETSSNGSQSLQNNKSSRKKETAPRAERLNWKLTG